MGCSSLPPSSNNFINYKVANESNSYSISNVLILPTVNGKREEKTVDQTIITKNGLRLDAIRIIGIDSASAFPSINQGVNDSVLPSELAELFIAEQKTVYHTNKIDVIKSKPIDVDNKQGFIVQYKMKTPAGVEFMYSAVGIVTQNNFYAFEYRAPVVSFYESGLSGFLQLVGSINVNADNQSKG